MLIIVSIGFFTVFLPPFTGEKINLAVTVLLGFLFVQEIIADLIPKSEIVPYLAVYVVFALIVSTFNVASCTCIVAVYNLPKDNTPIFFISVLCVQLGLLFDWCTKLICLVCNLFCAPHHILLKLFSKRSVAFSPANNQCCSNGHGMVMRSREPDRNQSALENKQSEELFEMMEPRTKGNNSNENENDFGWVEGHYEEDNLFETRHSVGFHVEPTPDAPLAHYDCDDLLATTSPPTAPSRKISARAPIRAASPGANKGPSRTNTLMSILEMSTFDGVTPGSDGLLRSDSAGQTLSEERKQPMMNTMTTSNEDGMNKESKMNADSGKENWQEVARVMNVLNSIAYVLASAFIFYTYFMPILPLSKTNVDINGKCPD